MTSRGEPLINAQSQGMTNRRDVRRVKRKASSLSGVPVSPVLSPGVDIKARTPSPLPVCPIQCHLRQQVS